MGMTLTDGKGAIALMPYQLRQFHEGEAIASAIFPALNLPAEEFFGGVA